MELRHLRYFVAVAEELHFGRAAQRLHLSTPTLSQQIQALEREIGTTLFERTGRGVTLTNAGRVLLVKAQTTLRAADTAVRETQHAGGVADPVVRLGLLNGAPDWLTSWLEGLAARALPERRTVFVGGSSADQFTLLERGEIDLAVIRIPADEVDSVAVLPIAEEELGILMSGEHPLAKHDELDPADLSGHELVWFSRRLAPRFHDATIARLRELGGDVRLSDTTVGHAQLRSVLPRLAGAISLSSVRAATPPEVVWRPLAAAPLTARFGAAWRTDVSYPMIRTLEAALRNEIRDGLLQEPVPAEE